MTEEESKIIENSAKRKHDYLVNQSKKCLEKSKEYLNNKNVDLAIFYNNASEGYKIKDGKLTIIKDGLYEKYR